MYIYIFWKRFSEGNVFPISLVSVDTKFRKFTRSTHYHDDTRLVNIRIVAMKRQRRTGEEEREREGDSSNQIHRDSSGHACRSGCTTLYRRLSSPPLDPIPPPRLNTPARLPPSRSFALLSMQLGLLPSCLHLIGPRVYTRCLGHV